jgi:DNA-binding response OmpR family regulator
MNKILLIDESLETYNRVLESTHLIADLAWCSSIKSSEEWMAHSITDIVILDIDLPDGNGIDFCSKLQKDFPHVPVFFLTVHSLLSEKILGFSVGAEDYITKPFLALELRARIDAKLKRNKISLKSLDFFSWDEISIDRVKQEVKAFDSLKKPVVVELTALEFKLLNYFANHVDEVVTRDMILDNIWGQNIYIYNRSVDTHVSKLRRKLGEVAHIIQSVHGTGYKFKPTKNGSAHF